MSLTTDIPVDERRRAAAHYLQEAELPRQIVALETQLIAEAEKRSLLRLTLMNVIDGERLRGTEESRIAALIEVYERTS
ncbi:MAG: hypothetical protein Q8N51_00685 [Gammaproteobacteria bacterium]|nr:hypothetical protein [Gammaproteobacteria bacterium]